MQVLRFFCAPWLISGCIIFYNFLLLKAEKAMFFSSPECEYFSKVILTMNIDSAFQSVVTRITRIEVILLLRKIHVSLLWSCRRVTFTFLCLSYTKLT